MRALLKKTLNELKASVLENLEIVRLNEQNIKIIQARNESDSKYTILQEKFNTNRELLNNNLVYLDAQMKIISFINKYGKEPFMEIEKTNIVHSTNYFEETVNGRIKFNNNHPLVADAHFVNLLIEFYQKQENYEKCSEIMAVVNTQKEKIV